MCKKPLPLLLICLLISVVLTASTYQFRRISGAINVYPATVWFEDPRYPNVNVSILRRGTFANITITTIPTFDLLDRSAIFYDTFDTNPFLAGRFITISCNWSYDPVMRAIYINGTQVYPLLYGRECISVANINVSSYSSAGRTIYVAFLFWRTPVNITEDIWADAVYLNTSLNRLYTIGWWLKGVNPGRTGDHVHPNIYYWRGTFPWTRYYDAHIGDYLPTFEEYILSSVASMINFTSWLSGLFNYTASYTATIPATDRIFIDRVGVGINSINDDRRSRDLPRNFTGAIYFDNFIVTLDRAPWNISVIGVPAGWRVVLRDATGRVLANVTSPSPTTLVNLTIWPPFADLLVDPYNRTGFIYPNATLEAYDATGRLVTNRTFDLLLGGDLLNFGVVREFRGTILSIYSNLTSWFNIQLANTTAPVRPRANVSIGMIALDGTRTTQNITIINGIIIYPDTNVVIVSPPALWTGEWLVANVTLAAMIPTESLPYNIRLNFFWWRDSAIIAFYSINITLVV